MVSKEDVFLGGTASADDADDADGPLTVAKLECCWTAVVENVDRLVGVVAVAVVDRAAEGGARMLLAGVHEECCRPSILTERR